MELQWPQPQKNSNDVHRRSIITAFSGWERVRRGECCKCQLKNDFTSPLLHFALSATNFLDSSFIFSPCCLLVDSGISTAAQTTRESLWATSKCQGHFCNLRQFTAETLHWLNPTNLFIWSLEIHVPLCGQRYCKGKKQDKLSCGGKTLSSTMTRGHESVQVMPWKAIIDKSRYFSLHYRLALLI